MEPDENLCECLAIYDKHESGDDLGAPLDRQWKTGQMAEAIVTHLVNANVFGVWRTYDPDEEETENSPGDDGPPNEDGAEGPLESEV